MQMLSDDCRYLVLLAKVQNKVDKHEEALLSLQRVSDTIHVTFTSRHLPHYFKSKIVDSSHNVGQETGNFNFLK